jgi:hypothetical protein
MALELVHAAGVDVGAGSDSEFRLEGSLQVERTQAEFSAQARQRHWFVQVLFEIAADSFHQLGLSAPAAAGAATQASAEPGMLGLFRVAEKAYVFPARAPGRACGAAIHSGRRDGEDKAAIASRVAVQNRLPAGIIVAGHLIFCLVEYRIGCHNGQSLDPGQKTGYLNVAVKANSLRPAFVCFPVIAGRRFVSSSCHGRELDIAAYGANHARKFNGRRDRIT